MATSSSQKAKQRCQCQLPDDLLGGLREEKAVRLQAIPQLDGDGDISLCGSDSASWMPTLPPQPTPPPLPMALPPNVQPIQKDLCCLCEAKKIYKFRYKKCIKCQSSTSDYDFKYRFKDAVEYRNIIFKTAS
jgi:hypothetical protein